MEKYYSVSQAAVVMGFSAGYVRLLLTRGKLRGARQGGGHWRIPESAIEEYLKGDGDERNVERD